MHETEYGDHRQLSRYVGWSLIGTIIIGIAASLFIAKGIDVNLTADVVATAENMLEAETRLRAKAYIAALLFALEALISIGFFILLRKYGLLLAAWCLFLNLGASGLILLGAVYAMNAAEIAGDSAYINLAVDTRVMLAGLQATSDYTSFHLGLIISTLANAGFFYLFLKSSLIPKIIAGWGLFASLFVVVIMVARDFIPVLGHTAFTATFMVCNLIALIATGLYLGIRGVRSPE